MLALVRHALLVFSPRGPMAARRMTAYWGVLAAAALTTLVAAAVAAAVAVFMGQALPLAVQHDLSTAPGTDMSVSALVNDTSQASSGGATLRSKIAAAMPGVPFTFQSASWSDPLELVPGALPASPTNAGAGNAALLQAASMSGLASHATLIAGRWPAAPTAGVSQAGGGAAAIPAALPASAATLLHVWVGDVLRLHDRVNNALVSFDITGIFAAQAATGPDDSYWALSYIPPSGVSASYPSSTYGPLVVSPAAFGSALTQQSGSWLAQPVMKAFPNGSLGSDSGNLAALVASLPNATFLNGAQMTTSLPTALDASGSNLTVALSLLVISALQILVLAVVALAAVGRLLAAQREGETALLIARGATRWQLTKLTATEVVPLSALVSVVGALAGVRLAEALVGAGALGTSGIRLAGRPGVWPDALAAAIVVALIAVAALLAPGLTAVARAHSGRQGLVAGVTRVGLDVALIVLAVLACWQLRQFSAVGASGTGRDRPGAGAGAGARARGRKRRRAAPASAGGRARGLAGRPGPGAARRAGLVAVQPDAGPPGERGPAAGDGGRGRDARARAAPELDPVGIGSGQLRGRRRRPGRPADGAQPGRDGSRGRSARCHPRDGGRGRQHRDSGRARRGRLDPGGQRRPAARRRDGPAACQPVRRYHADPAPSRGRRCPSPGPARTPARSRSPSRSARPRRQRRRRPARVAAALGPVVMTLTILDRTGAAFQVEDGALAADGHPHLIDVPLGGDKALYPLRVAAITVTFGMPLASVPTLALTLRGVPLAGWTQQASTPEPINFPPDEVAEPFDGKTLITAAAATFTFGAGHAPAVAVNDRGPASSTSPRSCCCFRMSPGCRRSRPSRREPS